MKILVLCEGNAETHDSWSGISRSVVDRLRKAGHQVVTGDADLYGLHKMMAAVLSFSPNRRRWGALYHFGRAGFELRSRLAARAIARHRSNLDVILQFGATFEPRGRGGIPVVLYCDSTIRLAERNRRSGFGEAVTLEPTEIRAIDERENAVYQAAAAICTISDYCGRSFTGDYGIAPGCVHTINAGPNIDHTRISVPDRSNLTTPPSILFVGREFGRKGGAELVEAFKLVRQRVPNAELVLVGPQDLRLEEPGVRSVGLLNKDNPTELAHLERLYAEARVFCLPSRFDCFPISFLEAMASGLPCVGTDIAGVPEIIAHGETGYVVPMDDTVAALAERLTFLLANADKAHSMGLAGRRRLESRFTWEAVAERLLHAVDMHALRAPRAQRQPVQA